ncbi:hypothetical protein [Sinomonas albida]|uniref:hypothetical protein n=1 Tax=Sinomonas albida TaxID=369942 RepID=UPI0030193C1C
MTSSAALTILILDLIAMALVVWLLVDLLAEACREAQAKRTKADAHAAAERLRERYGQARQDMRRPRP